jgi:hypothetical protein
VEKRLLNARGKPNFGLSFYIVNSRGEHAGLSLWEFSADRKTRSRHAVCTADGPQTVDSEPLFAGAPTD